MPARDVSGALAVIGMAGRFPGAADLRELWSNLREGREAITFWSVEELAAAGVDRRLLADPRYVRAGGVLAGADRFDAAFFGLSAREAELLDPQQRVFLECCVEALDDAGCDPQRASGAIGVYAGASMNSYLLELLRATPEAAAPAHRLRSMLANDKDHLTTRVAFKLDLRGPAITVQTACSSSLVAVHLAAEALLGRQCDVALAGGVSIRADPGGYLYAPDGILSPDGHCRVFDHRAAGTVPGSGVGVVVLKRLADALAGGDPIRAVILGSGVNNDGAMKLGYSAPSAEGQAQVIAETLALSGVEPETVGMIEAHGTGTALGDPIEVAALRSVFGPRPAGSPPSCALGSIKSQIGHLDAAAGIAGLIKTVLALEHGEIPASLHFERENPQLGLAGSPFYVNTALRPWPAGPTGEPRRAAVSSFGMGGTNAHVVLEEAPPPAPAAPGRPWQILVLSAKTETTAEAAARRLGEHLDRHPRRALPAVAATCQLGRTAYAHRRALLCRSTEEAAARLAARDGLISGHANGRRRVAFLLPGQGSQAAGMGAELYRQEPAFRQPADLCCARLAPILGRDLSQLLFAAPGAGEGEPAWLADTRLAQPALFVVEIALARLWEEWGVSPTALSGHSLGELAAACLAGVMELDEALILVAERARLIARLPPGAMLAVGLAAEEAAAECNGQLGLAAENGPASSVLSGPVKEIDAAQERLARRGVATRRLRAGHAFHSPAVEPILAEWQAAVARVELRPPAIPFLSNVTGRWIEAAQAVDPRYWTDHLRGTVRFGSGLSELLRDPEIALLEVGPGHALTALARRHPGRSAATVLCAALEEPGTRGPGGGEAKAALAAVARLWTWGVEVDWERFGRGEGDRRRVSLPPYPFERERYWIEPAAPSGIAPATEAPPAEEPGEGPLEVRVPSWQRSLRQPPAPGRERGPRTAPGVAWLAVAPELATPDETEVSALAGHLARYLEREGWQVTLAPDLDGGPTPTLAICFGPLEPATETKEETDDLEQAAAGLDRLLRRVHRVAQRGAPVEILTVSWGAARVTGLPGEEDGAAAGVEIGALSTLGRELPGLRWRAIDLPRPHRRPTSDELGELARLLLWEIQSSPPAGAAGAAGAVGGAERVAYRGRYRWESVLLPAPELTGELSTLVREQGGAYLVTDGESDLGLRFARHLARAAPPAGMQLAVVEPPGFPPREQWDAWRAGHRGTGGTGGNAGNAGAPSPAVFAVDRLERQLAARLGPPAAARPELAQLLLDLDALCSASILAAWRQAGIAPVPGLTLSRGELLARLGAVPKLRRFVDLMVRTLVADDLLAESGESLTLTPAAAALPGPERLRAAIEARRPAVRDALELLERCVRRYPEVLRGEVSGVEVLFPEGRSDLLAAASRAMWGYHDQGRAILLLGQLLTRLAGVTATATGEGRPPLRILEVGGGHGTLTWALLPWLAGIPGARIDYCFTDLGKSFVLEAAREAARRGYTWVRTAELDISKDGTAQGFAAQSFDLVLGLNVVHATPRIADTLDHLGRHLRPGGLLLLLENSRSQRWVEMIWGLTDGWWAFDDTELRQTTPLLDAGAWERALADGGWEEAAVFPRQPERREQSDCVLVLGRRPAPADSAAALSPLDPAAGTARKIERLRDLAAAGVRLEVLTADLRDPSQAALVVERTRRLFGPIRGVFHAAGGDDALRLDGAEAWREAAATTRSLSRALGATPPDWLILSETPTATCEGSATLALCWQGDWGESDPNDAAMATAAEAIAGAIAGSVSELVLSRRAAAGRRARPESGEAATRPRAIATGGDSRPSRPAHPRPPLDTGYAAPGDEIERRIAGVLEEQLGVAPIGIHDDFFALGGDSLIAVQVVSRLRDELGVDVPLRTLMHGPTVAELAATLRPQQDPLPPPAPPLPEEPPLSFAQERLWFLDQLEPGSAAYNLAGAVRLVGPLSVPALAAALAAIVDRHQVLRASYPLHAGAPAQTIAPRLRLALPLVDLAGLPAPARDREAARLATAEAVRPFDLARGPLLRAGLLRLAAAHHVALFTLHHIVSDAESVRLFLRELSALYAAFTSPTPDRDPLPELPLQYPDFAAEQRRELAGDKLAALLAYWRERLAGSPPPLALPTDRPPAPRLSATGHDARRPLPAALEEGLRALARERRATLFMVLLAGFGALLYRLTGEVDLRIAVPVANRERRGTRELIGLFVNTLVVRVEAAGDPTAGDLLGRVRDSALGAFAHQELPFERLVEELRPERDLAVQPLAQVAFNHQGDPGEELSLPGLHLTRLPPAGSIPKFDLEVTVFDAAGGLTALAESSAALFDPPFSPQLLERYATLLAGMVADPGRRIAELPVLAPAERHQLLLAWNDTLWDRAPGPSLPALFAAQVAARPEAVALVHGGERWTYRDLAAAAGRIAGQLLACRLAAGEPVAVLAGRGAALVGAVLGIAQAGGAYVPLDPLHPEARLRQLLGQCRARLLLVEPGRIPPPDLGPVETLALDPRGAPLLDGGPGGGPRAECPAPLAYILYTSGSTGTPKGAMIAPSGLLNHLGAKVEDLGLTAGDAVALTAAPSFDVSIWQMLAPLVAGARVEAFDDEVVHDPERLLAAVEERGVSVLEVVPSWLRVALAGLAAAGEGRPSLTRLRWLVVTGEELAPELCRSWLALYPRVPMLNAYGPTECADDVTHQPLGVSPPADLRRIAIGRPLANTRLYVLTPGLACAPRGVLGELSVGGTGVGRGYLDEPARTAEAFVPDPFSSRPGERLYRTGDLARFLPDGRLDFLGRRNRQVKIRGARIELGEIEAVLAEAPEVLQCAVVAQATDPGDPGDPGGRRGEGERTLVAYVVPRSGREARPESLRAFLAARLPASMIPAHILSLPALPLTPSGKVNRGALPRWSPGSSEGSPERSGAAGPLEELLAGLWSDVLDRPVAPGDSFFDLGGHSLLAVRVLSRLRHELGVELPLRSLFEAPTPRAMARRVEAALYQGEERPVPPILPLPRGGPLPLSFAQERLWFLYQLDPLSWAYNIPAAVELTGPLDRAALAASLGQVVRRHDALRTRVATEEGRPAPRVAPPEEDSAREIPEVDLGALPEAARAAEERHLAAAFLRRPFDLAQGPLWRAALLADGAGRHVALLAQHHLVSDGWSMELLIRELSIHYAAARAGRPSPLAPLPVQYADYAAWQRTVLPGPRLAELLAFWTAQLAGAPALLELPADRPRSASADPRGGCWSRRLPAPLTAALRALARRAGATLHMVFLAGFQTLLHRLSGQTDLVVGSPVANRGRLEVEELIGFFVNTLALRSTWNPALRPPELLERARQAALAAHAHQELPFEKLVERLQPERGLDRTPLFQVLFDLQPAGPDLRLPGLAVRRLEIETGTAQFDLTLAVVDGPGGLTASWDYLSALFDRTTVGRLAGQLEILLAGLLGSRPLGELPLLTPAEEAQLRREWNDTEEPWRSAPGLAPVHQLFAAQALCSPDAPALLSAGEPGREVRYGELAERAARLARRLQALGAGPEVLVALYLERSPELVTAMLAVLGAGAAYLPLDPGYPRERLELLLGDAQAAILVSRRGLVATLPQQGGALVLLDEEPAVSPEVPAGEAAGWLSRQGDLDGLAYLLYTSGSTGRPKGVMVGHRSLANYILSAGRRYGLRPGDRILQFVSPSFDVSAEEIYGALVHGATLVVRSEEMLDIQTFLAACDFWGITVLDLPTSYWHQLTRALEDGAVLPPAVRLVLIGGDAAFSERVAAWNRAAPPGVRVLDHYGPTEATITVSCYELDRAGARVAIGRPIANVRLHVVDTGFQPLPTGAPGELLIGGVALARGYLQRPDLTAAVFQPDPFATAPGDRVYRTGDRARWAPDGQLEFLGRQDHQVKIRGFRVELQAVEAALRECPELTDAAVVVREGVPGSRRLVACVVPRPDATRGGALEAALRAGLASRLPPHEIPAAFVELAALPLNASDKVDRRALAALAVRPESLEPPADGLTAPRTAVEQTLARLWAEVLGVETVGLHDNFFASGGDSILSVQLVAAAHREGLRLTTRQVFQAQTVGALAALAEAALPETAALPAGSEPGARPAADLPAAIAAVHPLSPYQDWLLARYREAPAPDFFLVVSNHLLRGVAIDPGVFTRAWQRVVDRHSVLRAGFRWEGKDEPRAVVFAQAPVELEQGDWQGLGEGEREARLAEHLRAWRRRGFDLGTAPHTRLALFRVGPADFLFVWGFDHAWQEGWSYSLILRDFLTAYEALAGGTEPSWPPPVCRWRDYLEHLGRQDLAAAERHWRVVLQGFAAPTPLAPGAHVELPDMPGRHGQLAAHLGAAATAALGEAARRHRLTLNTFVQGAWALALAAESGSRDVLFGVIVAGRPPALPGIEEMVGSTLNLLPLRARIAPEARLYDWLRDLQDQQSEAGRFDFTPPRLLERFCDTGGGPLFSSQLVFERFPIQRQVLEAAARWGFARLPSDYPASETPLRIEAEELDSGELRLTAFHHPATAGPAAVLLPRFLGLLESFSARPESRVEDHLTGEA